MDIAAHVHDDVFAKINDFLNCANYGRLICDTAPKVLLNIFFNSQGLSWWQNLGRYGQVGEFNHGISRIL